jgi:hypothetical protein
LLAEESVFEHQFRLGAGEVQHSIEDNRLVVGLCPTSETLLDIAAQSIQAPADEGLEAQNHGVLSWSMSGALDYTIESDHKSKAPDIFGFSGHTSKGLLVRFG